MDSGLHATAARKLSAVLARQPSSDRALYLLGACEMAQGRVQAADEAWARLPADSPFAPQGILGRLQVQMERGQLAEAERLVSNALADPRIDSSSLPILLGPVYCQQGRLGETLRLIEVRWHALDQADQGASEPAINLVRAHIELQRDPIPLEVIRSALDQAGKLAPDDDRVWLGEANLAIRTGTFDVAARWLDACLERRPEDVPVWRARLDWAMACRRVEEARAALKHLPVDTSNPAQIPRLAAWFAGQRGDAAAQRRALERLVAADPADFAALDRLAELAHKAGDPARAAELKRKRTEIDQLLARYEKLYKRNQPLRDAAEMARLADRLGRRFEARGFLTVACAFDREHDDLRRDLARLKQPEAGPSRTGHTLAEVLAAEFRD
jgi:enediyne biosynthesis protein E4